MQLKEEQSFHVHKNSILELLIFDDKLQSRMLPLPITNNRFYPVQDNLLNWIKMTELMTELISNKDLNNFTG